MKPKSWVRVLLIVFGIIGGGILALALAASFPFQKLRKPTIPGSNPPLTADQLPPKPVLVERSPGVFFGEVHPTGPAGEQRSLGIYLPKSGMNKENLPCVVIAPAGTRLFHGMDLGEGDIAEHLPYVKAGYVVVAYSLDGVLSESDATKNRAVQGAQAAFIASNGGVNNAKTAITYALNRLRVDPKRIVVAGHSSAATLALQVAAADPRVTACIAYAPCTDLEARLGDGLPLLEALNPGAKPFYKSMSPKNTVAKLHCPVFLFHARDDSNVPFAESESFAQTLKQAGGKVTFVAADSGDHYDSMIQQGIPAAQKWLAQRAW
ncbi:prolyl oligopeptidase family serine peptidase [Armatimonas sp.]|uniref:alpha/beta hydrolase family protein n=1 Tax=Armatimonas sp. TaxID=1872638 RepID=UPI00286C2C5B|nr:prolyl oligopeptidase family serine peptidase [Armatimonas sp.]